MTDAMATKYELGERKKRNRATRGEPGALCMNGEIRLVDRRGPQFPPLKKRGNAQCLNWNWMLIDLRSRHPGWVSAGGPLCSRGAEYRVHCRLRCSTVYNLWRSSRWYLYQRKALYQQRTEPSSHLDLNFHWVARTALMAGPRIHRIRGGHDWCIEARTMSRFAVTTRAW